MSTKNSVLSPSNICFEEADEEKKNSIKTCLEQILGEKTDSEPRDTTIHNSKKYTVIFFILSAAKNASNSMRIHTN